jgi:hypothetical protein
MSLHKQTNINHVLQSWPSGTVGLADWLDRNGVSRQLRQRYIKTAWIESLGRGAFQRYGDEVDWLGALYSLQQEAGMPIHVGGRTALGLQGMAHYIELNAQTAQLFAPRGVQLPTWFRHHDWGQRIDLHNTDFLPSDIGVVTVEHKLFVVKISGAARACLECLYLAPDEFDLVEAYELIEGLSTLRPSTVQALLEACHSIKVIRLFLYMAEKAGHAWAGHLVVGNINIGRGKRSLAADGVYIPKYQITVPKELALL